MKNDQPLTACAAVNAPLPFQTNVSPHILVVDDDTAMRELCAESLRLCGYLVDAAEDGAAAWEALNADSYDLLITDNNMPGVTGVELLKKLRAGRMALPVIMVTGTMPAEEFTRLPWLRPAATLIKPYTFGQLLREVKTALRETEVAADAPRPHPVSFPRHILAVDADRDLRRLYAEALARPDCSVDVAEDGAAGWKALQAGRYHLLITEHDLPRLTGVQLVRKLRAARMALPVVLAAGRLPTHELAEDPSLQLAAMLVKPFAMDALCDTVNNVLRLSDSLPENRQSNPASGAWQL